MHDSMTINWFESGMIGPSANCHSHVACTQIYQFPIRFTFWWYHKTYTVFWMYWFVDDLRSLLTTLSFDILKSTSEVAKRWQTETIAVQHFHLPRFKRFWPDLVESSCVFPFFFTTSPLWPILMYLEYPSQKRIETSNIQVFAHLKTPFKTAEVLGLVIDPCCKLQLHWGCQQQHQRNVMLQHPQKTHCWFHHRPVSLCFFG